MSATIRNLHEFIDEKILSTKIQNLTAPGENYGSLMLSVEIQTLTKTLNLVAKTLPPNQEMQAMFNCGVTFKNEIAFYKVIFPTLRNFQQQHGVPQEDLINFAAKCYGSRLNLHNTNNEVDEDAVLLLENLKLSGFINQERTRGFDLETSKVILKNLAQLHGVSIAFKLQQPEVFEKEFKPYLTSLQVSDRVRADWQEKYLKAINSVDKLKPYLERLGRVSIDIYPGPKAREPFGAISHNDCWVNNTMQRLINGKTAENRLVDFQICDYASPAKDVLFFLFSSVQNETLRVKFEELVEFYHGWLVRFLGQLKCDVEEFRMEKFLEEVEIEARSTQFMHTVLMLAPIFAPKLEVEDMADVKPSDIGSCEPTDLHKEKLVFLVEEFAKRNWI